MPPLRFQLLRTVCRLAFHLAAGFSALALVACVILWPLSYRHAMNLGYATSGGSYYELGGGGGRLWVGFVSNARVAPGFSYRFVPFDPDFAAWSYTDWKHEEFPAWPRTRGRALGGEWFRGPDLTSLGLPLLYLTLLAAILPAFWLRGLVRRWRQARLARRGFPVEPPSPAR